MSKLLLLRFGINRSPPDGVLDEAFGVVAFLPDNKLLTLSKKKFKYIIVTVWCFFCFV